MDWSIRKIDELTVADHSFIDLDRDECHYFMEYTARKGYGHSPANSHISNFKKPKEDAHKPGYGYKEKAIRRTADAFRDSLGFIDLSQYSLIPIPPSKTRTHEFYDDRMVRVLQLFTAGNPGADVRDIIMCSNDMIASHTTSSRPTIKEIKDNYVLDESLVAGLRSNVILFDDMLTSGAHYCACRDILNEHISGLNIKAIFISRRLIERDSSEFDDIFDLSWL